MAVIHSMPHLRSLARDQAFASYCGSRVLTTRLPRKCQYFILSFLRWTVMDTFHSSQKTKWEIKHWLHVSMTNLITYACIDFLFLFKSLRSLFWFLRLSQIVPQQTFEGLETHTMTAFLKFLSYASLNFLLRALSTHGFISSKYYHKLVVYYFNHFSWEHS